MFSLRAITIKTRMMFIITIVFIGLLLLTSFSLMNEKQALYEQQQEKVQKIVEGAKSIVSYYYSLAQSGQITDQEAKNRAIAILENYRYDGKNYVWINDSVPNMIMHPFKPALNGKPIGQVKDPDGVPLFVEMVNVVKKSSKGFVAYKWPKPGAEDPVDKVSYVELFSPWQWIIGTGAYVDNVDEIFARQRNFMLLISAVILAILIFAINIISKSIINPARQAYGLMTDIAEGEGDLTKHLSAHGKDAIARLGRSFNLFVDKMRSSLSEVSISAQQTRDNAELLAETSESNKHFIQNQSDNTTQVAAAMEQMTTNIKEVSNHAEAAEQAAIDAQQHTTSGKKVVHETIEQIEGLSQDIDTVSDTITELANESQNIGAVLDVIRSIADQTNLLALNAAIEAARAGEQGRGFAVVADEVRTLASRTGQSTDEIQAMIQKLQHGTKQAVDAVSNSQETSRKTVEIAASANASLTTINDLVMEISNMNSQIARATEQQTQAASEVNLRISELADMTGEALAMTESLSLASVELKQSSDEMSNVVDRFKLS
ncbi:methyl-accepting chemotaxis protein [Thalassotalea sp. M1531]|uniref:Methyl-accepting chemotaxis protein n=1 Tax=Thalassotalea algicola TaxID=2716224 RepID=A0A7Y0Q897_9GAMM|nr:methyl-accepting chemotaxis protein [Thalassotalea algicola]NMP33243.1 methyl-accepting chemotaxis protein [Thalassotalea algicola]